MDIYISSLGAYGVTAVFGRNRVHVKLVLVIQISNLPKFIDCLYLQQDTIGPISDPEKVHDTVLI